MFKTIAIAFATVLTFGAQAQQVTSVEIVEYGIYTSDVTQSQRTGSGLLQSTLTNIRHAATTTTIPAQHGIRFGFRFHVTGSPAGAKVELRKVTLFPAPGLKSPKSAEPLRRNEYTLVKSIGETSYTGYNFDDPWELVPGTWTVQLWSGDRKLAEQRFTVVTR